MKSKQGVSKAQMEVLRRMAAGHTVVICPLTENAYIGGSEMLRWSTFAALRTRKMVRPSVTFVASNRELSEVYVLTPAGRALVEDSRREK